MGSTFFEAFVEAPQSIAELEEIPKRVKYPLFVNMLSGGVTPILPVKDLDRLGYKIVVCPIESLMVCARAMRELCEAWKATGRVDLFLIIIVVVGFAAWNTGNNLLFLVFSLLCSTLFVGWIAARSSLPRRRSLNRSRCSTPP